MSVEITFKTNFKEISSSQKEITPQDCPKIR